MAVAGKSGSIAITGATTAATGEAMSVVSGKTYSIDDTTKEIWDPANTVTVKDNGSTVSAANISDINMLHGQVTFDSGYSITGPVTVDINYLPKTTISTARSASITVSQDTPDSSVFGDTARQRTASLIDASGSLGTLDPDLGTTVGGGASLWDLLTNGTSFIVEFNPGSGTVWRARALVSAEMLDTSVDDLDTSTLEWELNSTVSQEGYTVAIKRG